MTMLITMLLAQTCSSPFVCVDGTQSIGGQKVFTQVLQATGAYPFGTEDVSLFVSNGLRVGGGIAPILDGAATIITGRRYASDPAPGVIVSSERTLSAGGYFGVSTPCGQVFSVNHNGDVTSGPALDENCTQATDVLHRGMFVVGNTASGAVGMQSAPGAYLTLEYRLAEQCAILADGGRPFDDGGTEVQTMSDAGTCVAYAGRHGGVTVTSSVAQLQGLMFSTENHGAYGGSTKFYVHATGAYGQANGLLRSQFPTCPSPLAMTSLGQFYPGVPPGAHTYAADEDKQYVCKLTGWVEQ